MLSDEKVCLPIVYIWNVRDKVVTMERKHGNTVTMSERKAIITNADMSEMQQDAIECATQALKKYNIDQDVSNPIEIGKSKCNC